MPARRSSKTPRDYRRVLLRADGSASIGLGHVVRTLALARELFDLGAEVEVWGSSVGVVKTLAASFAPLVVRDYAAPGGEADELDSIIGFKPDLVIVDGYHFRRNFFRGLSAANIPYGIIDDNGETEAPNPQFVVNQNPNATEKAYRSRFPSQSLFLGPDWALIRQEFQVLQAGVVDSEYDVYLSLGGSDIHGLTPSIAQDLIDEDISIAVALGPVVKNREKLIAQLLELPGVTLTEATDAPLKMAKSEILILGAGSSLWEANALGKKSIGLVVADNQSSPAKRASSLGLISATIDVRREEDRRNLTSMLLKTTGELKYKDPPARLVDAGGAGRLAMSLLSPPQFD